MKLFLVYIPCLFLEKASSRCMCLISSDSCWLVLFDWSSVGNLASAAKSPMVKDEAAAPTLDYADIPISQIRKVIIFETV